MRSRSFYCIALLVLLSQDAGWGSAQEVGADWVQTRFVDKEHITAPTGISVSPDGVVFVSCDPNATTNIGRRVGKVVRCEDTDGDGKVSKEEFAVAFHSTQASHTHPTPIPHPSHTYLTLCSCSGARRALWVRPSDS